MMVDSFQWSSFLKFRKSWCSSIFPERKIRRNLHFISTCSPPPSLSSSSTQNLISTPNQPRNIFLSLLIIQHHGQNKMSRCQKYLFTVIIFIATNLQFASQHQNQDNDYDIFNSPHFCPLLAPYSHSSNNTTPHMDGIEHRTVKVNGINIHVAEKGPVNAPVILFIHGFPELWYSWRRQILTLSSLGYRAVAPDLRGFGDSDVPQDARAYTSFHVVGDLVALLEVVAPGQDKVFVVGHDWGAIIAWALCLYRPDKVKALVNLSVAFAPRNPRGKIIPALKAIYGDDYYICRFQEPGVIEAEFAQLGTDRVMREFLTYRKPSPLFLPQGHLFGNPLNVPITLPSWLSEEEVQYYVSKFEKTGFTGALNYYRCLDLNWELTAPWTGAQVKVPVKFIIGDQDLTYNSFNTKDYIHKGGFKRDVPCLDEVVVLEGVGHFIMEEKADEISKHIQDYFQKF